MDNAGTTQVVRLPDDPSLKSENARRRARATRYGGVAPRERSRMATATPTKRAPKKVDEDAQEKKVPRKEQLYAGVKELVEVRPRFREGELSQLRDSDGELFPGSLYGAVKPMFDPDNHTRLRASELAEIWGVDRGEIGRESDTPGTVWCATAAVARNLERDRDALRQRLAEEAKAMRKAEKAEDVEDEDAEDEK